MIKRILALWHARNLEFVRDRASLSWNLIFPLLLVVGFSFAFGNANQAQYKVGITNADVEAPWLSKFQHTNYIEFIRYDDQTIALTKLRQHQLDLVITQSEPQYWLNKLSAKGYLLEKILHAQVDVPLKLQQVSGESIRYVDWVLPGILGMNMMFSGLFGIGYVIVRYRKNGVLKRLKATPLSASEFIVSQILSRMFIQLITSMFIAFSCIYFLDLKMNGSFLLLFLMMLCGSLALISVGLMMASRCQSEEFAGALLNMASWPMMFLSGVWFSLDSAHPLLQQVANLLPLTHLVAGMRSIMLDGADLTQLLPNIGALLAIALVCITISASRFSWGEN
ncbi:MAG: ABC transporter permease [Gammaproteobacteria bacterium]|nr:ABC transporter permease [Gammaproteobacteria bacterium]